MHTCILVADEGNIYELLDRFAEHEEDTEPHGRFDHFGIGGRFDVQDLAPGPRRQRARKREPPPVPSMTQSNWPSSLVFSR